MRKIFCFILSFIVALSYTSVSYAVETEKEYKGYNEETIMEYKDYLRNVKELKLSPGEVNSELKELNEELSTEARELYRANLCEDVNEILSEGIEMPEDKLYFKKDYILDNGEMLTVEMYDIAEDENDISTCGTIEGHEVHFNGYKKYGDRKYMAVLYVGSLADGKLVLETTNKYTISSSGLTTRAPFVQAYTTSPTLYVWGNPYAKVTDSSAPKVGHDINVEGYAKAVVEDGYSVPTGTVYTLKADVRVKLEALDKTNKKGKVKQHVYAYATF